MVDRLIAHGLSVVVIGLITLSFGAAIFCGYRSLVECVEAHWGAAGVHLVLCGPLSVAATLLIRHKDDLMDK
jgi:hypothetical protein